MNFGAMQDDVKLMTMGNLGPDTISQLINRAQQQILESYDWSFLHINGVINSVAPKTAGSVTVAQGSPVVIGTDTLWGLEDVGAFIWFGGLNIAPIPIQAVQGREALTLSAPWPGTTIVQGSYVLAPLYYLVENSMEILNVRSITDLEKISRMSLNAADPARVAQGGAPSTNWCDAPVSPDGSLRIELWPVPADARPYLVDFKWRPPIMVEDSDVPQCPYAIIEAKAMMTACLSLYGSTGQRSWMDLGQTYAAQYDTELNAGLYADSRRVTSRSGVIGPWNIPGTRWDSLFNSEHDMSCPP